MGLTVRRLLLVVAASAAILGLAAAFQVPAWPGALWVGASCLAVLGVACAARNGADLASALASIAWGIGLGFPLNDPCTCVGILFGPALGLLVRIATRPFCPAHPEIVWEHKPVSPEILE